MMYIDQSTLTHRSEVFTPQPRLMMSWPAREASRDRLTLSVLTLPVLAIIVVESRFEPARAASIAMEHLMDENINHQMPRFMPVW
jgi:hypothetical protein